MVYYKGVPHIGSAFYCYQTIMLEKDMQTKYTRWMKKVGQHEYGFDYSHLSELKLKKRGQRLNFRSDIQDHQIPTLIKSMDGCVYHKISDMAAGAKPSDTFQVCHSPMSPFVVGWWEPRKKIETYFIDPKKIHTLWQENVKSITEADACEMAFLIIEL